MVWLHPSGKQLMQWPIHELESLRGDRLYQKDVTLNKGEMLELIGLTVAQVCTLWLYALVVVHLIVKFMIEI